MAARTSTSLAALLAIRAKVERRRYWKRLERCQRKFSESAVHDLRIETRRLLAMLDLLQTLHFPGPLGKIRKAFKQRLDAFDELRDTQVQLSLLRPLWRQFPEARELGALLGRRERRFADELRQGIRATKSARLRQRLKTVEKHLRSSAAKIPRETTHLAILAALRKAFDRVVVLRQRIRPTARQRFTGPVWRSSAFATCASCCARACRGLRRRTWMRCAIIRQ